MSLLTQVKGTISRYSLFSPGEKVVVGVSGGPDSLCLLHLLNRLKGELEIGLQVAHLNHGIRGEEAEADAVFIEEVAQEWGLPITVERRDVPAYAAEKRLALEEAARQVRYAFLAQVAHQVGARSVAVGHNADDQVETILMHWLRGAGLAGLRGMRPLQGWPWPGEELRLVRPLLELPRADIEAYCREEGLEPRFDRSNLDTTYHRNRIRHHLLPLLEEYNPNIREVIRRAALIMADDYDYLRLQGEEAWERLAQEGNGSLLFDLEAWDGLHPSLQRQLLRRAIHHLRSELRNIDWIHIEQALEALGGKPAGTKVTLPQGLSLFKSYRTFAIGEAMPSPDLPLVEGDIRLEVPGRVALLGGWELEAQVVGAQGREEALSNLDPWQAYLDLGRAGRDLTIRGRRSGDRFQPLGMGGQEKALRQFMIDAKIPRHIRDKWLLVVSPQHIVWVAGYRIDERVRVREETEEILLLRFQRGGR